jgi:hypothetical protein
LSFKLTLARYVTHCSRATTTQPRLGVIVNTEREQDAVSFRTVCLGVAIIVALETGHIVNRWLFKKTDGSAPPQTHRLAHNIGWTGGFLLTVWLLSTVFHSFGL